MRHDQQQTAKTFYNIGARPFEDEPGDDLVADEEPIEEVAAVETVGGQEEDEEATGEV